MTLVILLIYYIVGVTSCQPVDTPPENEGNADPPTLNTDNSPSLLKICIWEVCQDKKKFEDLTLLEQGMVLGKMDEKYRNCARPLRVFAIRSKLKDQVKKNYPKSVNDKTKETIYGKPDRMTYCDAMSEMINSPDQRFTGDEYIMQFRNRLAKYQISNKSFMKFVRWLYNQFSDKAAHEIAQYAPSLPEHDDVEAISDMLKCVEMDKDIPAIKSIQVILEPFQMPSREVLDDVSPHEK